MLKDYLRVLLLRLGKMLNLLATQKDKTQRQIISFINGSFISLLELVFTLLITHKLLKSFYNCLVRSCARSYFAVLKDLALLKIPLVAELKMLAFSSPLMLLAI